MMNIDRIWRPILTTLQKKDAPLKKEDIARIQDELKVLLKSNSVASHALHVHLLEFTKSDRALIRNVLPAG